MFVLWLLVNGEDLNTRETLSVAAATLYSYVRFSDFFLWCLCIAAEVENVVLLTGVGAAFRKDLHEVCKAKSTTEVSFRACQVSRSVGQSVKQSSSRLGKVRLCCLSGNRKPDS